MSTQGGGGVTTQSGLVNTSDTSTSNSNTVTGTAGAAAVEGGNGNEAISQQASPGATINNYMESAPALEVAGQAVGDALASEAATAGSAVEGATEQAAQAIKAVEASYTPQSSVALKYGLYAVAILALGFVAYEVWGKK